MTGAGRRSRPVGRTILLNIRAAGFAGQLPRVSRLADDLPQVAELDLNPAIARPDGIVAVDARIHVASHRLVRPFLRRLPQ